MEQDPGQRRIRDRFGGLRDLIYNTLDAASELPPETIRASVETIVDKVGDLTHVPNTGEVTKIVQNALETAGEGAGAAAEAAGGIAGNIVEGLGDIDLNVG